MGILSQPPPSTQIAAAQDYLFALLEAVKLAQARIIQTNLLLKGTAAQQEAFRLEWSEIRGKAANALALGVVKDSPQEATIRAEVNQAVTDRIINNPAYQDFSIGVAGIDDPLMR
jgi:hypothetical protein